MPILVEDSVVIHGLILEQPIITDWAYFAGLGFQLIQSLLILGSPIIIIAWLIRQSTTVAPLGHTTTHNVGMVQDMFGGQ